MNLAARVLRFMLPVLLAMAGSGILFYVADGNLASGNMHNVVRNWEQYGLVTLKGKLVTNPGGYEALARPKVHKGHRPASLYPVFLIKRLFAWSGPGTLAVHVVLSLTLLFSTWSLLGQSRIAWLAGAAALLCPGYIHDQVYLDPNVIALLMGLPFAAILLPLLARPSLSPMALTLLLLMTAAYTALNWTTGFIHAMLLTYLFAARQISTRRLWLYVASAGVSLILVTTVSVLDKRGHATLGNFLGDYLWGAGGYGAALTPDRAVVRLLFVATAGLLPLLLLYGYVLASHAKKDSGSRWRAFSPLIAAFLGVGVMRNYFGAVPWMAAVVFLAGFLLSLRLILEANKDTPTVPAAQPVGKLVTPAVFLVGCFAYALGVTAMASLRDSEARALVALMQTHTTRSDTIVLVATDTTLTSLGGGVADFTDRRVVVLTDLSAGAHLGGRTFLLSTSSEVSLPLVGRTSRPAAASWPLVQNLLALYSTTVARRFPGDQGFRPGTCYLYEADVGQGTTNVSISASRFAKPW